MNKTIFLNKYGLPLGLLALVLLLQLFNLDTPLLSGQNIQNILMQTVSISLAALGLSLIMISGEGDMSFAGMFSMLSVTFALVANNVDSFWVAFIVVMVVGVVVNLIIITLVNKLKLSSFITSIAVMFMATGIEKALHQQTTLVQSDAIKSFATMSFGLPMVIWIALILYVVFYIVTTKTKLGFQMRIVGENKDAGLEVGINIQKIKILAYVIAGLLLALAATTEATRVGAIYEQGKNYMLPIFAACYLGSSMFTPGRVNVAGTLVGALFMGVIDTFMKMMNVPSFIIPMVQGAILIISVGLVVYKSREKIQQVKV